MAIHASFNLPVVSESHARCVLGPFPAGRTVRGLHVWCSAVDLLPGHFMLAAAATVHSDRPGRQAYDELPEQFFQGLPGLGAFEGYIRLPCDVDVYLPLQVEFDRDTWIIVAILSANAGREFDGTVCAACGLGSVRSGKRRGRVISIVS